MNASSENPYSAPVADGVTTIRPAPAPFGWEARNGKLLAGDVALLPMVDPFTGLSSERMTMVRVRVRYRPWWLWILPLGLPILAVFAAPADRLTAAFFMLTLGLLARTAAGLVPRPCELRIFVTFRTYQRRRHISRFLNVLLWISLINSIDLYGMPSTPMAAKWIFPIWLAVLGVLLGLQRRLYCWSKRADLFEIGHMHPAALQEFGSIQATSSSRS